MKELLGHLNGSGLRFGIVVARFNQAITEKLLAGAIDGLRRNGASEEDITVAWVPGAYEIPVIAKKLAHTGAFDAIIGIGCVIRGATAHFDFVAGEAASGITRAALDTEVPVIFGVITPDTLEQATQRAGTTQGNKGFEAALGAIEMADLMRQIKTEVVDKQEPSPANKIAMGSGLTA